MESMSLTDSLTLHDAIDRTRAGTLTAREIWRSCSDRIERLNPLLNAFITLMQPEESPVVGFTAGQGTSNLSLTGMPIAVKDLFETSGVRTTAGSQFFKDYIPDHDAAAVTRIRAAGGQIIGKTNTHEIALGVTTVNPHFGTCRNPWDTDCVAGGSSGGSAVAVATGMALAALGTDTGGSIRIPASLCGVVGLKPTFGRISLRGVFPLSWNLDHVGPLARCVTDAALMLQVIAGYDEDDPQSVEIPVDDYTCHLEEGVSGWRIALANGSYAEDCDLEILEGVLHARDIFDRIGASVTRVDLSFLHDASLANGLMTQADAATYHRQRLAEHPDLFGSDVRRRLEIGRSTSTTDYILARRTQSEMKRRLERLMQEFEIIMLPATAITAPMIDGGDAVEHARLLTRFTAPFNLTGLPAISIPCGFSHRGLPIGLQLVGRWWDEAGLLRAARAYERETDWWEYRPGGT